MCARNVSECADAYVISRSFLSVWFVSATNAICSSFTSQSRGDWLVPQQGWSQRRCQDSTANKVRLSERRLLTRQREAIGGSRHIGSRFGGDLLSKQEAKSHLEAKPLSSPTTARGGGYMTLSRGGCYQNNIYRYHPGGFGRVIIGEACQCKGVISLKIAHPLMMMILHLIRCKIIIRRDV